MALLGNIAVAIAAAFQLIQTIQSPPITLTTSAFRVRALRFVVLLPHSELTSGMQSTLPVSLGIAERANVAEILRKAGPQVQRHVVLLAHTHPIAML